MLIYIDIELTTRTFSLEVANLGAWACPCASPQSPESDTRARLLWFAGTTNNSFSGARALVSVAVVTMGTEMSIAAAFNNPTVTDKEAAVFMQTLDRFLKTILADEGQFTLGNVM